MRSRAAVLVAADRTPPFASSRPIEVVDLDLGDPGPGELVVRIDAAGLCHSDLSVVDGNRPRPTPMVLGHEAAGTVVETGPGVRDIGPGDRVVLVFVPRCGACAECASGRPARCERAAAANASGELLGGGRRWGSLDGEVVHHHLGVSAFAEQVVVDRGSVVPVPDDVPAEVAALLGCALLTGGGAVLSTAAVRPGESVAVIGLGGVGSCAVLAARLAGAQPIVAIDPVAAKRELARDLGADVVASPEEADDVVRELLPRGVDHAIEAVGSSAALTTAWQLTARGGATVAVGLPHPSQQLAVPIVQLVGESRRLLGSYLGDAVPDRDIPRYVAAWRAGRLPIERLQAGTRPLDELNEALDELASAATLRQLVVPSS